jgi:hypothetical protein
VDRAHRPGPAVNHKLPLTHRLRAYSNEED